MYIRPENGAENSVASGGNGADPYTGKGKPEVLKREYSGFWSRRINSKDRIVYQVDEQSAVLYIVSLRKHYC